MWKLSSTRPTAGWIGAANDFPGIAVVVDMAPPGQRLESNFQAALGGAFAKFAEIGRRAIDAAARFRRDIATHEQRGATKLLHQIELSFRTIKGAPPLRIGRAFKVAKRLECDQG